MEPPPFPKRALRPTASLPPTTAEFYGQKHGIDPDVQLALQNIGRRSRQSESRVLNTSELLFSHRPRILAMRVKCRPGVRTRLKSQKAMRGKCRLQMTMYDRIGENERSIVLRGACC